MLWILRLSTGWNLYLTLQGCPAAACAWPQQLRTAVGTARLLTLTSAPTKPPLSKGKKPGEHCVACLHSCHPLWLFRLSSQALPLELFVHTCADLPYELTEICSGMLEVFAAYLQSGADGNVHEMAIQMHFSWS